MPRQPRNPRGSLLNFAEDLNGYCDLYYIHGHGLTDAEVLLAIWDGPEQDGKRRVEQGELESATNYAANHKIAWRRELFGRWGFCEAEDRDSFGYCLHEHQKPGRGAFPYTLVKLGKRVPEATVEASK